MKFVFYNSSPPPVDVFVSRVRMENRLLRCVEEAAKKKKKKKRDEQEGGVPEPANASLEKVRRLCNNPAAYAAKVGAAAGEWGRGSGGA